MQLKSFLGIVGIASIAVALPVQVKTSLQARQNGPFDHPGDGTGRGGAGTFPPNPAPNNQVPTDPNTGLPNIEPDQGDQRPIGPPDPLFDSNPNNPIKTAQRGPRGNRFKNGHVPPENTEDFPTATFGNSDGNNQPITDGPITESPPDSPPDSPPPSTDAAETAAEETGASAGPELGTDVASTIGDVLPEVLSG